MGPQGDVEAVVRELKKVRIGYSPSGEALHGSVEAVLIDHVLYRVS